MDISRAAVSFTKLTQFLKSEGGQLVITYNNDKEKWVLGLEFGREAEDSDMAGGASYYSGIDLEWGLNQIVQEVNA